MLQPTYIDSKAGSQSRAVVPYHADSVCNDGVFCHGSCQELGFVSGNK